MRVLRVLCCVMALAVCLATPAKADEWNKLTYLTFSGPVQIPGMTLPAGTYTFKLADLAGNRHVVQIFDKDGKKIYATLLAIPDQRLEPSDKPVVMFRETAAGTPPAIRAWFYPGNTIGDEFVYPRRQALEIARASHESVLSTTSDTTTTDESAMKSAEVSRVDESAQAPAPAEPTAGTTGTTPPPAAERSAPARTLPSTASPLALYELVSGLAFAGALGVRQLRKRMR